MWERVLGPASGPSYAPNTDFFDAGGHSLLLAKLAATLGEEAGVTLSIQDILERPTLDGMARLLEDATGGIIADPAKAPGFSDGRGVVPIVLKNGSEGVTPASSENASAAGVEVQEAKRAARLVDLAAEARRLDPAIYPAATRKAG